MALNQAALLVWMLPPNTSLDKLILRIHADKNVIYREKTWWLRRGLFDIGVNK
jgi:hypothetical protein